MKGTGFKLWAVRTEVLPFLVSVIWNIYFAPLSQKKKRPIINLAADYALNILGMEEVFVSIKSTERPLIDSLEQSFENLGEEDGYVTYLKEKESQAVSNFTHLH